MVSTVTCYKNTGFDRNNRPSDVSVLGLAESTVYDSVWVFQNLDRISVRVKASYSEIEDVDYVKIGSTYYIVTGLNMLTEQTAELALSIDPVLTAGGVSNLTVIGGWDERAHVSSDPMFGNIIEEPFVPSNRLERTSPEKVVDGSYVQAHRVVAATVDLTQVKNYADQYYDIASESTALVSVPRVPAIKLESSISVQPVGSSVELSYNLPVTTLFNLDNDEIKEAVTKARSLGIEAAITSCYLLPVMTELEYTVNDDKTYVKIKSNGAEVSLSSIDGMAYRYGGYQVKNNKAFALFNSYLIFSVGSGESREYDAHDVYMNDGAPTLSLIMDCSPNGKPYLGPRYYLGDETVAFQDSVGGAAWRNNPLSFTEGSGSTIGWTQALRQARDIGARTVYGNTGTSYGLLDKLASGDIIGAVMSPITGLIGQGYEQARQASDLQLNYDTQYNVVAPTVNFPVSDSIQGFLGNSFYVSHTHLSDGDLERFDNFLTQFGYKVDKKFEKSDLTNRQYFNYIKTNGAVVKAAGAPLRIEQMVADTLNGGVRLWHVLPNSSAMTNNPIA